VNEIADGVAEVEENRPERLLEIGVTAARHNYQDVIGNSQHDENECRNRCFGFNAFETVSGTRGFGELENAVRPERNAADINNIKNMCRWHLLRRIFDDIVGPASLADTPHNQTKRDEENAFADATLQPTPVLGGNHT